MANKETCARCGHESKGCPKCSRNDPILGGTIEGKRYCHTFGAPLTCYEAELLGRSHSPDGQRKR